jgi:hypothetical protein
MISLILGMALLVTAKTLALDKTVNLAGALLLFIAMGLMCYSVLAPLRELGSSSKKVPGPARTSELPKTDTTKELPPARISVPAASVTERTTQLIDDENAGRSRE